MLYFDFFGIRVSVVICILFLGTLHLEKNRKREYWRTEVTALLCHDCQLFFKMSVHILILKLYAILCQYVLYRQEIEIIFMVLKILLCTEKSLWHREGLNILVLTIFYLLFLFICIYAISHWHVRFKYTFLLLLLFVTVLVIVNFNLETVSACWN